MKVLSQTFCGSIAFCECGAVLAYGPQDIYQNKYIYCPICKTKLLTAMDLSYDGLKEEPTT